MAVRDEDESLHHATEDLILPTPRKFYPALIQTSHWQLRSLLCSAEQNILFYPSGNDIIALHIKSREREVITTLSFPPRCLAVTKEWLCIGGEDGHYTAISLSTRNGSVNLHDQHAEPDARLPLDLGLGTLSTGQENEATTYPERPRPLVSKVIKLGDDIINCITLWSPPNDASNRVYKVPVAVISNNENSIDILKVETFEVLQKIVFPDCINRAFLSPDGELLLALSDDPFLYIYARGLKSDDEHEELMEHDEHYKWVFSERIQLEGQRAADKSTMRGSFAACISKSGKYLAVATQYGLVSIFDFENLLSADSLLTVFTSSRPNKECGAIRAMEFSPGPFDLLAWTEASGRVGVADMRNMYLSRQLLTLDHNSLGMERVIISERSAEPLIDPRLRSFRTDSPSATGTDDYHGLERRQLRQMTREMLDRHQAPLTVEELEVLQAHRIARRQRDVANAAREALDEPSRLSSLLAQDSSRNTNRVSSASGLPAALREFMNPDRTAASFRSFINERNQDRERRTQQQVPRRRSSLLLAAAESVMERETTGTGSARTGTETPDLGRLTLTPPHLPSLGSEASSNPWAEIDALYRNREPADPPLESTTRLRVEVEDDDRRDFAHRLRQPWRPMAMDELNQISLGIRNGSGMFRNLHRSGANETMGCCWREDGRILYVGTENGIYEYHVDVGARKKFPSLVLR